MMFRVFTNDRGKRKGVPMYSALAPLKADTIEIAQAMAEKRWRPYVVKAIEWPAASRASKDWLAKHVGA